MYEPALPSLAEWETFCVIVGSSAAALTGLMFVVIALRSERVIKGGRRALAAFATPTVMHFCAVLLIISLMCMPRHTVWSLTVCLGAIGTAGLALAAWVLRKIREQESYELVREDWIFHVLLPVIGYGSLLASAIFLWHAADRALYAVASSTLLLLFIGIHNAWDAAVYIAMSAAKDDSPK